MNRQDRQGVRSPTDIERKYDLGAIVGLKKAVQQSETGIYKTNRTLEDFVNATTKNFSEMQEQMDEERTELEKQMDEERTELEKKIDAKAEIWFFQGVPTMANEPVKSWDVGEYAEHVGDMYYDRDTGYAYRFKLEAGVYSWEQVQDQDTASALAKANAAADTADGKRRVFMERPTPPYDNGDLWIYEGEIYICQISKGEQEPYVENDFILATKYTDDTLAKQIGDELEIVRGTVTTIRENADSFQIEVEQKLASVDAQQRETVEEVKRMSYGFGTEGMTVEKSGSPTTTRINENGMRVYEKKNDTEEEVLKADKDGVDARNLHATTWLIVGENSRFEDYINANGEKRTGCFWIGETGGAE